MWVDRAYDGKSCYCMLVDIGHVIESTAIVSGWIGHTAVSNDIVCRWIGHMTESPAVVLVDRAYDRKPC